VQRRGALSVREPTRVAHERQAVQRKSDAAPVEPVALPIGDLRGGALGTALAACEKESENSEALTLPGARGEVKLDRCYRGRDHLVCSFNALGEGAHETLWGAADAALKRLKTN
jgi:hypothetical protein